MIVSHKFRFIFVKTRKTAGTSLEISLSGLCGDQDIFSPIIPAEPGHQPRNFRHPDGRFFFNHMTATQIASLLSAEQFNGYLKFCIERHPVDKCISFYAMLRHSPYHFDIFAQENNLTNVQRKNFSWEDYLAIGSFPLDHEQYSIGANLQVDRILKYESIHEELESTLEPLGVRWKGLTSRAKSGFRTDDIITPQDVTRGHRELIMQSFTASNRLTGYT